MKIIKLGGAALANPENYNFIHEIINRYKNDKMIIVVSALEKTTRNLIRAAEEAESGNKSAALDIIAGIIKLYSVYAEKWLDEHFDLYYREKLNKVNTRLIELISSVAIMQELTARTLDVIMSYGEELTLALFSAYFTKLRYKYQKINSRDLITTDSNFGNAAPIAEKTKIHARAILSEALYSEQIVITQGFVAANEQGETTTMGMESSNLTAALLAEASGADEIIYYTDVDGIRSADPKLIGDSLPVSGMNYKEAKIASHSGLKLIHPNMISFAEKNNIRLYFKNISDSVEFTEISRDKSSEPLCIYQDNLTLLRINARESANPDKEAAQHIAAISYTEGDDNFFAFNLSSFRKNKDIKGEYLGKFSLMNLLFLDDNIKIAVLDYIKSNIEETYYVEIIKNGIKILAHDSSKYNHFLNLHNIIKDKKNKG